MNETAPLAPTRHKLDVHAFHRMAEVGIIGIRDRIELIDGDLIDMAPIGDKHVDAVDWLTEQFVLASHGRAVTSVQSPLRLDGRTQPQPDLILYRRDAKQRTQRGAADALLVVEVSDSSLENDTITKRDLYASFGVVEYWVVDIPAKQVLVHRQPSSDGYRDVSVHSGGSKLTLAADASISIDLESLFG